MRMLLFLAPLLVAHIAAGDSIKKDSLKLCIENRATTAICLCYAIGNEAKILRINQGDCRQSITVPALPSRILAWRALEKNNPIFTYAARELLERAQNVKDGSSIDGSRAFGYGSGAENTFVVNPEVLLESLCRRIHPPQLPMPPSSLPSEQPGPTKSALKKTLTEEKMRRKNEFNERLAQLRQLRQLTLTIADAKEQAPDALNVTIDD